MAAYGFGEASGTTVLDASGNGHTGTLTNVTRTTSGRFGGALVFNGTNSWVTVPDATSLHLTSTMTLEGWAYPTATQSAWRTLITKEAAPAIGGNYYLEARSPSAQPACGIYSGGTTTDLIAGTALPLNAWTHVAATCDGTTMRLYLNGTLVGSRAQPGAAATSTSPLRFGGSSVWGEFFQGRIDEIRIYNRALAQTEIQTDMNTAVGN